MARTERWELSAGHRIARSEKGWTMLGGEEDERGLVLHILVHHPESDDMVRLVDVRIPLSVFGDEGQLIVGEATSS